MSKKRLILILSSVVFGMIAIILYICLFGEKPSMVEVIAGNTENPDNKFDFKIIHKINEGEENNYLVSPLSIGYALFMLKEGSYENTRNEINELLGNYQILRVNNVKNRIGIANGLFINSLYKKDINNSFISTIRNDYDADVVFDKFNGPKVVNDWVNKKTFKMIPSTLKYLSQEEILVLVNTVAINLEWEKEFNKDVTHKQEFTKADGSKIEVAMMGQSNNISYIKSDKAQGIIKNYKNYDDSSDLEYIAILPNGDIKEYINNFNEEEFGNLLGSKRVADGEELTVNLNLPKYTYDYTYEKFKNDLVALGLKSLFTSAANFKGISQNLNLFVSDAIHKTHIEVSEEGTKAAAVTAFTFKNSSMPSDDLEVIDINFDKPFIYIIKDRKYNNIWFFGTVYEPMKWEDNK